MSPSPELTPDTPNVPPTPLSSADAQTDDPPEVSAAPEAEHMDDETSPSLATPVLHRPPVRPVHRPQPPAKPVATSEPAVAKRDVHKPEPPASVPAAVASSTATAQVEADTAAFRLHPIPPPSEPKQYRAIGLIRGRYVPSEEEFTRGDLETKDMAGLKAVLLGRVMSLVRSHLDLTQEHLWVVYPRTREINDKLHIQILGVWEPETLKQDELAEGDDSTPADLPSAPSLPPAEDLESDYFSVRGEVVFYSPDQQRIVVKIHQMPRKNSQKAKAFKLILTGELASNKTVGYFWDLHVKRDAQDLVVTESHLIGLAPPKKNPYKGEKREGRVDGPRPRQRPPGQRPPMPTKPVITGKSSSLPRREPAAQPSKTSDQSGEG